MSEASPNFEDVLPDYDNWRKQDSVAPWEGAKEPPSKPHVDYPTYFSKVGAWQLLSIADKWASNDEARLPLCAAAYDQAIKQETTDSILIGHAALAAARTSKRLGLSEEVTPWVQRALGALNPDDSMSYQEELMAYEMITTIDEEFPGLMRPQPQD